MKSRMSYLMFICLALLTAPSLYAVPISYTLGELIESDGFFVVGDKLFHDFRGNIVTYPEQCSGCILTPTSLNSIAITPYSWGPGLFGFRIAGGLAAYNPAGVASIDIAMSYRVSVVDDPAYKDNFITDYHLSMGGYLVVPRPGGAGFITVGENFVGAGDQDLGSIDVFFDGRGHGTLPDYTTATIWFEEPQKSLYVMKDINLTVDNAFAIVSIVEQYASQNGTPPVPEPTTVSILGLGLVAMGVSLRKKLF